MAWRAQNNVHKSNANTKLLTHTLARETDTSTRTHSFLLDYNRKPFQVCWCQPMQQSSLLSVGRSFSTPECTQIHCRVLLQSFGEVIFQLLEVIGVWFWYVYRGRDVNVEFYLFNNLWYFNNSRRCFSSFSHECFIIFGVKWIISNWVFALCVQLYILHFFPSFCKHRTPHGELIWKICCHVRHLWFWPSVNLVNDLDLSKSLNWTTQIKQQ